MASLLAASPFSAGLTQAIFVKLILNLLCEAVRRVFVDVTDGNDRAFRRETMRHCGAEPLSSAGDENNVMFVAVHGAPVDGRVVAMVVVDSRSRKAVSAAGTSFAFQWASKTSSSLASPCLASIVVRSNSSV